MARLRRRLFSRWGRTALDLLIPPSCVACRVELARMVGRVALCDRCRLQLTLVDWPVCSRCAARVPDIPGAHSDCFHCRAHRMGFDRTWALGEYDGLLRELVLRMKQDRSERIARALGELMAEALGSSLQTSRPDVVTAVPMHRWRRLARGTNPAAALAGVLGARLGQKILPGMLRCRRNTSSQMGLSVRGRFRNLRHELRVAAGYHLEAAHVLLVDDVLTTGATCSEAARALKQAGAAEVSVVVVARTSLL